MRAPRFVLPILVLPTLVLAGCDSASVSAVEGRAEAIAATTCGFIPDADIVARIVIPLATSATGTGSPAAIEQASASVASAICAQVMSKGARRGFVHVPSVRGVAIHGRFLDGRAI